MNNNYQPSWPTNGYHQQPYGNIQGQGYPPQQGYNSQVDFVQQANPYSSFQTDGTQFRMQNIPQGSIMGSTFHPQQYYQQQQGWQQSVPQQQPSQTLQYKPQDLEAYNDREFLCKAFNYKVQYIQAFLALPAQLKLKFYISLEEVKLYGQMKDREAYQAILAKIAIAVRIIKGLPLQNPNSINQQKPVTMEDRINKLVDFEYKKLHVKEEGGALRDQDNQQDFDNFVDASACDPINNHDKTFNPNDQIIVRKEIVDIWDDNFGNDLKSKENQYPLQQVTKTTNGLQKQNKAKIQDMDQQFGDFSQQNNQSKSAQIDKEHFFGDTDQNWEWNKEQQKENCQKFTNLVGEDLLNDEKINYPQSEVSQIPTFEELYPSKPRVRDTSQIQMPKFKWLEQLGQGQAYKDDIFNLNIEDDQDQPQRSDGPNAIQKHVISTTSFSPTSQNQILLGTKANQVIPANLCNIDQEQFDQFTDPQHPLEQEYLDSSNRRVDSQVQGQSLYTQINNQQPFSIDALYKNALNQQTKQSVDLTVNELNKQETGAQSQETNGIRLENDINNHNQEPNQTFLNQKTKQMDIGDLDIFWGSVNQSSIRHNNNQVRNGQLIEFDIMGDSQKEGKETEDNLSSLNYPRLFPVNNGNAPQDTPVTASKQQTQLVDQHEDWSDVIESKQVIQVLPDKNLDNIKIAESLVPDQKVFTVEIHKINQMQEQQIEETFKQKKHPQSITTHINIEGLVKQSNEEDQQQFGTYSDDIPAEKSLKVSISNQNDPSLQIDTDRQSEPGHDHQDLSVSHQYYQNSTMIEQQNSRLSTPRYRTQVSDRFPQRQDMNQTFAVSPGEGSVKQSKFTKNLMTKIPIEAIPDQQHPLLKPLLLPESQALKSNILLQLRNNSFECNTDFYHTVIEWLAALSFTGTETYNHLNQQLQTVQRIKQLTQIYSKAVEQDQQEKLNLALKQSKTLYQRLACEKTKKMIQSYRKRGNRTLLYDLAEFVTQSGVSIQFIDKLMPTKSSESFPYMLTTLYVMQKNNVMQSIPLFSSKLNTYMLREYEKFRQMSDEIKAKLSYQEQDQLVQTVKYTGYIQGLGMIAILCRRMCTLMKISSKNTGSLVKVLKICKELENTANEHLQHRQSRYMKLLWNSDTNQQIVPQQYCQTVLSSLKERLPKAQVQQKIGKKMKQIPICKLCFGGENLTEKQGINIHVECWNLYRTVSAEIQD